MTGTSTAHQIPLGDYTLTYTLTRKSVKRINLRIGPDGRVQVSAPHRLPHARIEAFIQQRGDAILRAIRRAELREALAPTPLCLEDGAEILHFGLPLTLRIAQGKSAFIRGEDTLTLTQPNPDDAVALRRLFSRWQESEIRPVAEAMAERHSPDFLSPGKNAPALRFRSMVSRWGSCRPVEGVITLNTCLAGAPLPCTEYVLLHELTHLHHPDHSPRFYAELSVRLPDWKARKQELDNLGRRLIPHKTQDISPS